jgi:hypothetical protein
MAAAVRAALYLRVSAGAASRQRSLHPGSAPPGESLLCVARLGDRRWSNRVPRARASEARRLGNTQAITRCGEPMQLHEPCNFTSHANSIVGRDFRPNHTERRAIAGPWAFNGLCDDEGVPLICPTCQVLAQSVLTGDRLLLCMGLFSIFLVGSQSDAAWLRESCLKPHTPARPLL